MAIGITSGFSPALSAGAAGGQAAAAAESPLGLFGALLQIATGQGTSAQFEAATSEQQTALGALLGQKVVADIGVTTEVAAAAVPATDATALLGDLLDQLGILADALDSSAPVEASLELKIRATVDALAGALGIKIETAAEIDASAGIAAPDLNAALDPLATIAAAASVPTLADAPVSAVEGTVPAAGWVPPAIGLAIDVGAASTAAPAIAPNAGLASEPAVEAAQLPATVKALADKITELAASLENKSPQLSIKLNALAKEITAGRIDVTALASLGLDVSGDVPETELFKTIERLLMPAPDPKPVAQAPFVAATLALPEAIGLPKPASTDRNTITTAPAEAKAELEVEPELSPRLAAEARVDARVEKPEAQPAQRSSVQAVTQTSAGVAVEAPSTPAQTAGPASISVPANVAADTKAIHAAYKAPVQQINIPQIAFEIVRQVEAGGSRFQIRLDPPELGRVDVKLDVDKAGNVSARLTVERAETLDLMQRDQRALERALAQAGLDSNKTNLEFSLRQNPFARDEQQQNSNSAGDGFPRFGLAEADEATAPPPHSLAYRSAASAGGINLFV